MPYHDLHLPFTANTPQLSHTLSFAGELGYNVIAISTNISGKLPSTLPTIDLGPLSAAHPSLKLLTRLTLSVSDTSQNHRLSSLQQHYSLVALRPLNEKSLQLCCTSLDCDIISLDLSVRLPFLLKFKTVSSALQRGIRFEISYSPALLGSSDAKRNLIAGATSLIRATRGRGIILSSEARNALGLRAPHDVMNLAQIWGLEQARGKEALVEEPGKVVRLAALRRTTYRGVVGVIDNGKAVEDAVSTGAKAATVAVDQMAATPGKGKVVVASPRGPGETDDQAGEGVNGVKRKASSSSLTQAVAAPAGEVPVDESGKPLSKREMKRRAKKAKLQGGPGPSESHAPRVDGKHAIRHEVLDSLKKTS